jgi:1,4-dihydroxy-2-naphthoyl-CoA hydrolase
VNQSLTPDHDGPGQALGLVYEEIGPEVARGSVPVTDAIRQPHGLVHGGLYPLIAESLASRATGEAVAADGNIAMGQSNSATYMRPVSDGTVHATARRRHAGRSTWIWDVEITDDGGRLCALVRMTIAVRPRPSP